MSIYRVQEHIIQASHIREYHRSLADENDNELQQAVKQYTPFDNLNGQDGDVTIIGGHANGFPKELYEPLWDELYHLLKARGINIRHIFIADVAFQGQSGVLNESRLGNDPAWSDTPRDLFLMVNHFRADIKQPVIGIGHSMGGVNLVGLATLHPRLFTSLILIDPPLQRRPSSIKGSKPARASAKRRDKWPSRAAAEAGFKKSKFYQTWDPRVLNLWLEYGLREVPTQLYSDNSSPGTISDNREVTLTTTKHQEVLTFLRAGPPTNGKPSPYPQPELPIHLTHPDMDADTGSEMSFYRPELSHAFLQLQNLRPSVFWIFADQSDLSAEILKADKLANTGTGVGGSGGVKAGRVSSVTMKNADHLVPYQDVAGVAEHITAWMGSELARSSAEIAALRRDWDRIPRAKRSQLSEEYVQALADLGRPQSKVGDSKL